MTTAARDARIGVGAIVLAVGLAVAAAGVAGAGSRGRGAAAPVLLPDIVMRPVTNLAITKTDGQKLLRFSTIIGNQGPGVVEMFPVDDDCNQNGLDDDRSAFQQLYLDTTGDGIYEPGDDAKGPVSFAGCSYFHPAHNHWHFEEFARYTLSRPATGRVVAQAEKVSFCIRDSIRFDPEAPGSPPFFVYGECSQVSTSGLSVGWADLYASNLAGQELDIRGLPDHRYCLSVIADPGSRVIESNDANNGRRALIRIRGQRVTDLGRACRSAEG
jgi:hypothetical protein